MVVAGWVSWWLTEVGVDASAHCAKAESGTIGLGGAGDRDAGRGGAGRRRAGAGDGGRRGRRAGGVRRRTRRAAGAGRVGLVSAVGWPARVDQAAASAGRMRRGQRRHVGGRRGEPIGVWPLAAAAPAGVGAPRPDET